MYNLPKIELLLNIEKPEGYQPIYVNSPKDIEQFVGNFKLQAEENFYVFHLSTKHEIIGLQHISRGTIDQALIHPREVFKGAIASNAKYLYLMHNHPSGASPEPSFEDIDTTRKLIRAGNVMGIEVLDHLIISQGQQSYSFREKLAEVWE